MLLAPPSGGAVSSNMTGLSPATVTYSNTLASPILVEPGLNAQGSGNLTIAGTFSTNQGFSDPLATSTGTGTSNVTLAGGTLALTANVPALVATAGTPFNFVLGTGGGTISIPSSLVAATMDSAISGSGGLTKAGAGSFTLGGAAVDTFTGGVNVTGTLNLNLTSLPPATDLLNSANAVTLNSGSLNLIGNAAGVTSQTIASLSLAPVTSNSISINPNGGTSTALTIAGTVVAGGPTSALNINYLAGTTNGSTVGNDIVAWNPTTTSGIIAGGYTVTDHGGTGYATVVNGDVVRLPGTNPLPAFSGGATQNYAVNSSFSTVNSTVPGSLVEALSGPDVANSVTVDTTGLTTGANLQLGTTSLSLTAGMTFGGPNPYTITSATSTAGILSALSAAAIIFNNYDSNPVTIAAPILDNSVTAITLNGPGTTVFSGADQYSGTTTISTGATLQIGDPGSLGGGNYAGNITDNGTLEYSSGMPQTLSGVLSGSGGITKDGTSSTLTLAGTGMDTYTGPTILKAGTIAISNGSAITSSSSFTLGDPLATAGSVILTSNIGADFTYPNPITVVGANQTDTIVSSGGTDIYSGMVTLTSSTLNLSNTGSANLSFTGGATATGTVGAENLVLANNSGAAIILSGSTAWSISGAVMNIGTGGGGATISSVLGSGVTGVQQNSSTSPLVLGGANSYTSGTTINAGTLQAIVSSTAPGTGTTLSLTSGPLGAGLLTIASGETLDLTTANAAVLGLTGGGTVGTSSTTGSPTLTIVYPTTPQTYAGTIVNFLPPGGEPVVVVLGGAATGSQVFTNGSSTYSGGTSIGSGTVVVDAGTTGTPGTLTSGPLGTGPVTLSGGTLSVNGAFTIGNAVTAGATSALAASTDNNATFAGAIGLSGNATISQVANTGTNALTVSGAITSAATGTQTVTFAGPGNILVSGAIGLGTGTVAATISSGNVTFSGTNTYLGATSVSGGVLTVTGKTSATSAVTVGTNGTLAGTGTLAGGVTISGTLDPGGVGAIGTLKVGSLSLGSGTLNVDLGATTNDEISVNGTANLGSGTATLNIASSSMPINTTVTIVQSTGALTGTFFGLPNNSSIIFNSGTYAVRYSSTSVTLTFVQPPNITSPTSTTFSVGSPGTFSLAATGTTPITYHLQSGTLPSGVTLATATGILSGTPAAGTAGTYPVVFIANNGGS